jgi:hypothetical protein
MKTKQFMAPVMRTLATVPQNRTLSQLGLSAVLGWLGSRRRSRGYRSRRSPSSALIAAGVLFGGAAAYLFGTSSGRNLRTRMGKSAGGGVGKLLGEQVGAHPVATAKTVKKAREILSTD